MFLLNVSKPRVLKNRTWLGAPSLKALLRGWSRVILGAKGSQSVFRFVWLQPFTFGVFAHELRPKSQSMGLI